MTNRYLIDFINDISPSKPESTESIVQFGGDKTRSAVLESENQLMTELLNGLEIPERTKSLLSLNVSTSAIANNRPAPSRVEKIQALFDFWKFLELINFHGGPLAFSDCHRELVAWKFRPNASFRSLVLMPRGHLKAQPLSTPVFTTKGWKTIGTLEVGDDVYTRYGTTTITHLHPISEMDLWEVEFSDGRKTRCNDEHLWEVYCPSNWRQNSKVVPLKTIRENYLAKRYDKRYDREYWESRYYVEPAAVKSDNRFLLIQPYEFGLWLGDGHSISPRITSADPEVFDYCASNWSKCKSGKYLYSATKQGFQEKLRTLGVFKNKHIPQCYLNAGYRQRVELLCGLMDSDGTCSTNTSITTHYPVIRDGIVQLVRSLGGITTVSYVESVDAYYIEVKTNFNPFNLKRKASKWRQKKELRLYIKAIRPVPRAEARCITVSDPSGIYLTDSSYIPTHNSTLLSVAYSLWRIYQNPNIRLFVGCESLKLSKAFIREVEAYLVDDWCKKHIWNDRPHFSGQLIPNMDSLGKQRRSALVRDISSEFGDEFSTGDKANTKKKVWRAEAIQVVRTRNLKEPTLTAGSVGQTSTGFHFDEVVFDDVHTFDNCSSETKIEKVYSWIFDIESVLDDPYVDMELLKVFHELSPIHFNSLRRWAISGGRMSVIGTRYDDMDFYGHVIENAEDLHFEVYQRNIYVNGLNDDDGYLWPEKWNADVEKYKRAQFERAFGATGLARFYSQYYNRIEDLEDAVLDWQKVVFLQPNQIRLDDDGFVSIFNYDHTVMGRFKPRLIIDPTSTASKKSDFCAMVVGGKIDSKLIAVDFWMKRVKPEVWLEKMYELINKWNLYEAVIEMVGGFKILETTIRNMWVNNPDKYRPIAVKSYNPPTNMGDGKIQRIETVLSPIVSNGLLYLPLHASRSEELSKQFRFFGRDTTKDDGVDVLAILEEKALKTRDKQSRKKQKQKRIGVHPVHGGVIYHDFQHGDSFYDRERRWGGLNVS